ncbi:peptidoglycan-associated lipoprotein Pal [Maridesulfovibrio hydrothermalis]|uniref:Peptidoglycan-associated lipoprotein n=1 Tax=Maridesulfovibrio hydrothermalis AM13 = DSM 14728 TaxID=1121451 RepID=L0RH20_9BACT|nr:peptidoglycan-associated lipoprotein Pal [Maridesulfovibrio hydrothermalis]CCO24876.1 putative Peptidoglycan-associated lipoprotein [Maridesulfovibrio hydrothermalis AM13 = DSM 14728]
MKARAIVLCVAFVLLAGLGAGCSKKRVESSPASPAVEERMTEQRDKEQLKLDEQARIERERALQEEALMQEAKAAEAKKMFDDAVVELGNMVHFDFDSFDIKQEYRPLLQSKAEILKKYDNVTMVIEGYCDDRGTEEYNLALGERRARAAYEFLILLGVAPERLSIVSYGEEDPIDPGQNETAWAQNRRAQFRLTY